MSTPEDLFRAVAERQDRRVERLSEEVVRETLRRARSRPERSSRRWPVLLAPAAVALALVFFVLLRASTPSSPAPSDPAPPQVPSALSASIEDGVFLFEDGTSVLLAVGGEGQVLERSDLGGRVRLARGKMRISVPPDRGRRWEFLAGPYLVEVKGTRFDLGWEPETERFDLEMLDGSVRVSGGEVEPRLVVAGQKLVLGEGPRASPSPGPTNLPAPVPTASLPHAQSARPSTSASLPPNWQAWALEGKYKQAVEAAEATGFESVLAKSSASELLLLGDACRLGGKPPRAVQAYTSVRERFADSLEAQRALFSLGAAAFPSASAAAFFEQYLAEAPGGALAPEALGRILELKSRSGDREAARAAATRYLARFPNGAHARLAKTILDEATP
jgi:hypothetical protein